MTAGQSLLDLLSIQMKCEYLSDLRFLSPAITFFPAQTGQPLPPEVRDATEACHSCPFSQRHHTLRVVPGGIRSGIRFPFFVGCHWVTS